MGVSDGENVRTEGGVGKWGERGEMPVTATGKWGERGEMSVTATGKWGENAEMPVTATGKWLCPYNGVN